MASKVKYELVATVGEYQAANGAVKKRYQRCGTVFEKEDGKLSIKLDAIPAGNEWNGWLSCFEPKERDGSQQHQGSQQRTPAHSSNQRDNGGSYGPDDSDEIPFAPYNPPF